MMEKFNVAEWLKTVDVWDPTYDYVQHPDHWLTSKFSANCKLCQEKAARMPVPPRPKIVESEPKMLASQQQQHDSKPQSEQPKTISTDSNGHSQQQQPLSQQLQPKAAPPRPPAPKTSQPVTAEAKLESPPLANNSGDAKIIASSPPVTPRVSPIPNMDHTKAFVTPYTASKFNNTFTRQTRQSTKKLLNQTKDQLIQLNDTYDLYASALADTPETQASAQKQQPPKSTTKQNLLLDLTTPKHPPPMAKPTNGVSRQTMSNLELLTNNSRHNVTQDFNPVSLQEIDENEAVSHLPASSRIPGPRTTGIPVRKQ